MDFELRFSTRVTQHVTAWFETLGYARIGPYRAKKLLRGRANPTYTSMLRVLAATLATGGGALF
jgi:hypothetical protein